MIFTGPPTAGNSTVTAAPSSVPANGSTTSTVTVTLKDVNSNPIAGKTVTLASDRGATDTISAASGASNASGVVTFTVKSSTMGTANFTAADTTDTVTITETVPVTFTVIPPADLVLSSVTATPSSVVANGSSLATITVTLKDVGGNPVSGKTVTMSSDRGATDTISAASGPSTLAGVVTFTVKSTTAGTPVFTATDTTDSVIVTQTATVTFTWPALVASAGTAKSAAPGYPATIGGSPTASGGNGVYTYLWSPTTGLNDATVANPIASPSETTLYTVTLTDSFGSTPVTSSVTVSFVTPNPNLISVDIVTGPGTGNGTGPCVGDTTLTGTLTGGQKNSVGNIYTGQLGPWNALNIGTYSNNSATTAFLKTGSGALTTVKLALGLDTGLDSTAAGGWRCNPNEATANTIYQLRDESAYLYNGVITGDHYAWALTGLTPNTAYNLTLFGDQGNATGASNVANTVAGARDSEGDWNWTAITSDATGKIVGTFTAPNPTLGIYGAQIEGPMPLSLTANAGPAKNVSSGSPATLGGSPAATGGSGTYSYSWSPTTGLNDPTLANPIASPIATTTYTLTVTDTTTSLTSTNSVVVTFVAAAAYNTWAHDNITAINPTADATATGDPDGDGVTNLTEFALHGDPLSGANNGYQVTALEDTNSDGLKELTLTLAVRNGTGSPVFSGSPSLSATVDGITYTIEGSLDLTFPNSVVSETSAPTGLPALPAGWEYRRFRLDASNGLPGKGFLRAKVTEP